MAEQGSSTIDALRRENRVLHDQVAALQAQVAELTGAGDATWPPSWRLTKWHRCLASRLYASRSRPVSMSDLLVTLEDAGYASEGSTATVGLAQVRQRLVNAGYADPVINVWGCGWHFSGEVIAAITAWRKSQEEAKREVCA